MFIMTDDNTSNSFSRPPVLTQILAYILVTFQFFVFTLCLQNHMNSTPRVIILVLYYGSFIGLVTATCITSCCDPSEDKL